MMEQSVQKGHPKGLYVLFATEFWERFSYYGMRAIFALYMLKMLFNGDKGESSNIYGTYTGLVYLTPLIGGYVADRFWGNRKSIFVGGFLMAIGQFFMFLSASFAHNSDKGVAISLMWTGLAFLIFGNGFFKPNISTMVGQLYKEGDIRKDSAYTIFYMGINAGAFIAPFICGFLGENVDFKWGFLSAGIGMVISLITFYFTKDKYLLSPEGIPLGTGPNKAMVSQSVKANEEAGIETAGLNTNKTQDSSFSTQQLIILIGGIVTVFAVLHFVFGVDIWGSLIYGMTIVAPFVVITDKSLSKTEKDKLWVIIIIMLFVIFFWMCFEQAGASLTFFADEQTNRTIFGWKMPASYFQSFNAGFIIILAPILSAMWTKLSKRGIDVAAPYKQSLGLAFLALGFLFIAFGSKNIPIAGASIIFLTGLYFLHTIGELFLSPIGLSMVNKLTPLRFTSLMMGVWFLAIATGNKLAGTMSSLYPEEQNVSAEYKTSNGILNGVPVDWNTITYNNAVNTNSTWEPLLVKRNEKSKEPDSLVGIKMIPAATPVNYDSVKVKRIIPGKMSEEKIKQIARYGDKEPKFIFGVGAKPNEYYLLKNDMTKQQNITLERWNTNPVKPKFMGIVIKDLYTYFMLFVGLAGIAAVILFLLSGLLKKKMHGVI